MRDNATQTRTHFHGKGRSEEECDSQVYSVHSWSAALSSSTLQGRGEKKKKKAVLRSEVKCKCCCFKAFFLLGKGCGGTGDLCRPKMEFVFLSDPGTRHSPDRDSRDVAYSIQRM